MFAFDQRRNDYQDLIGEVLDVGPIEATRGEQPLEVSSQKFRYNIATHKNENQSLTPGEDSPTCGQMKVIRKYCTTE